MFDTFQSSLGFAFADTPYGLLFYNVNDNTIGLSFREYGEWAINEINFISRFVTEGATVLDIGANVGSHTLAFSTFVGRSGRVVSFEPQRIIYQALCTSLGVNGISNVHLLNCALSDKEGYLREQNIDYSKTGQNFGAVVFTAQALSEGDYASVPVKRLDDLRVSNCSFIKIDAESMEHLVLAGAERTIQENRPVIYAEAAEWKHAVPTLAVLERYGYQSYLHKSPAFNPDNRRGNQDNHFGPAVERNIVAIPAEKAAQYASVTAELPVFTQENYNG